MLNLVNAERTNNRLRPINQIWCRLYHTANNHYWNCPNKYMRYLMANILHVSVLINSFAMTWKY